MEPDVESQPQATVGARVYRNEGKLVGQKAPLKLKEI